MVDLMVVLMELQKVGWKVGKWVVKLVDLLVGV